MVQGLLLVVLSNLAYLQTGSSQFVAETQQVSQADLDRIRVKQQQLVNAIERLRERSQGQELLADVEIYSKAADWIVRHGEFFSDKYVGWTLDGLDRGLNRAGALERGEPGWVAQTGRLSRGYISRIDHSVQPYGLLIPADYGKDPDRQWRLDVELHGRGATLNEVSFLQSHESAQPVPADQEFIQLDIFGRTNNAYRWAGETDVFEAIESVRKRYRIDERRVVLRGFSMGGAGAWHLGLHYPDRWCSVGPGAGFTDTKKYQKIEGSLAPWQEATLHIYDAEDYAHNALNVPIVAYGGEKDPQLAASQRIRESLERTGVAFQPDGLNAIAQEIPFLYLVGPNVEHQFHPESRKRAMAFHAEHAADRLPYFKDRIRFVTYTLKYPGAFGYRIRRMNRHYEAATIESERASDGVIDVRAKNVGILEVSRGVGEQIRLGGDTYDLATAADASLPVVLFEQRGDRWGLMDYLSSLGELGRNFSVKRPGVQGPIDDAFTDSFLCVRGTGDPWSPALAAYSNWSLDRFAREWDKYMRGRLPLKNDVDVTDEDVRDHHLILFGDPGSNKFIREALPRLPVEWTRQAIRFGNREFSPDQYAPMFISPNPLNARRYVVINSGHTFHEREFKASNAQLYPRLGDFAVIRFRLRDGNSEFEEATERAGIFDENWNLPAEPRTR